MIMKSLKFLFVFIFVLNAVDGGEAAADMATECNDDFQSVMTCLSFAQGKVSTPTKECCDSATNIKESRPKCLCFIIQQMVNGGGDALKSMGVQPAKLLQLPSACQMKNATISYCTKLLGLSPSSPGAAIFTNTSSVLMPATPSIGGSSASATATTTTTTTSSGTRSGPVLIVPALLIAVACLFHAIPAMLPAASLF